MKKLFVALAILGGSLVANADHSTTPAWVCSMAFKGSGGGLQIILGKFSFAGKGRVSCLSAYGERVTYPVNVTMKSHILSPSISLGAISLSGRTGEVALFSSGPEAIIGDYVVGQGQISVLAGAGAFLAVKPSVPDLALKVSVQFSRGLGINLGVQKLRITLDQDGKYDDSDRAQYDRKDDHDHGQRDDRKQN